MLTSTKWSPNNKEYGALVFILGSMLVSIGAVIISAPIGIAIAILTTIFRLNLGQRFYDRF